MTFSISDERPERIHAAVQKCLARFAFVVVLCRGSQTLD